MTKTKVIWTVVRTLSFILIGLVNTLWAKPEDVGSWKTYFGFFFLILAVADILLLGIYWRRKVNTKNIEL